MFNNGLMPIGLLRDCLDYALNDKKEIGGVMDTVIEKFSFKGADRLLGEVSGVYNFRNTYIAHQDEELKDVAQARTALSEWVQTMVRIRAV